MWNPPVRTGILIVLSGFLALGNLACSNNDSATPTSQTTPVAPSPKPLTSPSPTPTVSSPQKTPTATKGGKNRAATATLAVKQPAPPSVNFQRAVDIATGATNISKSAVSRDDWGLVALQWQQAINWLKAVPATSSDHVIAQKKLGEYQKFLAEAKLRSTPPPTEVSESGDINPVFFSIPIKGREYGIPIVEVTFNGKRKDEMLFDTGASKTLITLETAYALQLRRVGFANIGIADGSVVRVPVVIVKSIGVDGHFKKDLEVSVAEAMSIGLLGQDFFEGYDVAIKENIIEFRRR